ncbi:MAG: tetratricopeptide repeat protein [Myxococcota bacterium]
MRPRGKTGYVSAGAFAATLLTSSIALEAATAPNDLLRVANRAAEAGEFDTALKHYQTLVDASPKASGAWFNLGNAAYRAGQLARAIAAYRIAETHAPRDPRVLANLDIARQDVESRVVPPQAPAALRGLFFWHFSFSPAELGWLTVTVSVGFWILAALALRQRALRPLPLLLGTVLVSLVAGSYVLREWSPRRLAVVKRDNAPARAATNRRADVLFELQEGAEIEWRERSGVWVRVSLPSGQQGWIHNEELFVLEL